MNDNKLDEILEKLNEIAIWTKLQGREILKPNLVKILKTDSEKAAYELSNGVRTTREIAKEINLNSKSTIIGYWQKWERLGLVEVSEKYKGRMQHLASLEEVGIELPKVLQSKKNLKESKIDWQRWTNRNSKRDSKVD